MEKVTVVELKSIGFEQECGELRFSIDSETEIEGIDQANNFIKEHGLEGIATIRASGPSFIEEDGSETWYVIDVMIDADDVSAYSVALSA